MQDQARPGWAGGQHDQLADRGLVDELQACELQVDLAGIDWEGRDRVFQQVNTVQVCPAGQPQSCAGRQTAG